MQGRGEHPAPSAAARVRLRGIRVTDRSGFLLGVDLGAGSLKASVIDAEGGLLGEASHPIQTRSPQLGWAEQDPEDWYRAFCRAVPAALQRSGVAAKQLAAIGISGGAHIAVLLDAEDRVIRPAILWSDQRSAAEAAELHDRAGETIIRSSLNKANATWTLAHLAWLQRHEPEAVARVHRLFISKDYLRYRVTGDWHSDFSDAVGALMADAQTRGWSPEICALIDWPMSSLPPLLEPHEPAGTVTAQAAADAGLVTGIPVVTGSNDTTVELYGAGAVEAGQGAIKLATAGVLFQVAEGPAVHPPISCYPHVIEGLYYTATGTNSCASAHRWLRDQVFAPLDGGTPEADLFAVMDRMAGEVPPGSEGLIFHPYLQGERAPYWDPHLRADFIGLTMRHGRAHMARALYEGIAFSIRDLMAAARAEGLDYRQIRLLGGGARSAVWRQIMADVIGLEIDCPERGDASFGAALVAGLGAGLFDSPRQAVERCVRLTARCQPHAARHALYSDLFEIYKEAQARLAPLDHKLHALAGACPAADSG